MEMYDEINAVFMPANATSILRDPWIKWLFLSLIIRNRFHRAIAARNGNSSGGPGQNKTLRKPCRKVHHSDTIKNISVSWEESK